MVLDDRPDRRLVLARRGIPALFVELQGQAVGIVEEADPLAVGGVDHDGIGGNAQSIQLADVTLDVLYTHEDSVNSITGKPALDDENDSCTVIRVTAGEMSALITGDMSKKTEEIIMGAFTKDTLSVDILQVAHHGFNNVDSLYSTVHAPIAIIPQSEGYMHYNKPGASAASTNKAKREILTALSKYATIYYSGAFEKTVGFAVRNGEVTVIYGTDLS